MEFFAFRLNKVRITRNREWGKAEIKFISMVTPDNLAIPALDELLEANDRDARRTILTAATEQVLALKELIVIDKVKDGHVFTFGDTGYALHTSTSIPDQLNWALIGVEFDDDVRELGALLDGMFETDEFDGFVDDLYTLLKGTPNAAFQTGLAVSRFVGRTITKLMRKKKNDLVGAHYQSFSRFEHYPHGERKRDKVPDTTGNMFVDYSIFATTY